MKQGVILKALSGFYYVFADGQTYACRARGKFRHRHIIPLVGDRVLITLLDETTGSLDDILPRSNEFQRPAVANIEQMVIIVSQAIPVSDPYLIDRIITIAEARNCTSIICINKCDLENGEDLYRIYHAAGFPVVKVSAETGEGIEDLRAIISGKVSAFTGNSGVGKSSILNVLSPHLQLKTGEVSDKLGRGRHTTRHVELVALDENTLIADTPGFSSFDADPVELCRKEELENYFHDFSPYLGQCRFQDCRHIKEKGCAVLEAVKTGAIQPTRHHSYCRLYEQAAAIPDWERKESIKKQPF